MAPAADSVDPAPRVLIAKPGLDGHDRGALIVVRLLREAGFDVDYTGIRQTPDEIAERAAAFGAEVVGVSILSGAHLELLPQVMEALAQRGLETVPVVVGGIVPEPDRTTLLEMGVVAVFGPGARSEEIIASLNQAVAARRRAIAAG